MFLPRRPDPSNTLIPLPGRVARFLKWTRISPGTCHSLPTAAGCSIHRLTVRTATSCSSIIFNSTPPFTVKNLDSCFHSHRLTLPPSPRPHQDAFHRSLTYSSMYQVRVNGMTVKAAKLLALGIVLWTMGAHATMLVVQKKFP